MQERYKIQMLRGCQPMDDVSGIDKMHYIVDGNGNYYRINRKNQLVARTPAYLLARSLGKAACPLPHL